MVTRWDWFLAAIVAGVMTHGLQVELLSQEEYKQYCAVSLVGIGFYAIVKLSSFLTPQAPWCKGRFLLAWAGLGLATVLGLAWSSTGWRAAVYQRAQLLPQLEGQTLVVEGRVADLPRSTAYGMRLVLEVSQGWLNAEAVPLPHRVLLSWAVQEGTGSGAVVRLPKAGEVWRLAVRLRRPHGQLNPYGFDREAWLWAQGLGATGYVRTTRHDSPPLRVEGAPLGWLAAREQVRQNIATYATDPRLGGIVAALVVGDQAAVERRDWDLFRATGVAHLMSISGLHITLWAWLSTLAVGRLWRWAPRVAGGWGVRLLWALPAPVAAAWGGWFMALAYALFSGWGIPAQRTVIMLGVFTGLRLLGRFWPWPVSSLLAMSMVLAWDPLAWLQPGFWLSFVAVAVLMSGMTSAPNPLAQPDAMLVTSGVRLGAATRARVATGVVVGAAVRMVREQGRMTLALAPLTLLLFGQISVVGLVANLVAIPLVTLVITPLALGGVVWSSLWAPAQALLYGLMGLLEFLNQWPWASVIWPRAPWWMGLAAVLGAWLLVARLPWSIRSCGVALLLPVLLFQPSRPGPGEFEVLAADVGQGSAVLLRTASSSVLYDAGPRFGPDSDAGQQVLVPLLHAMAEPLKHVLLSHEDSDHVGGAKAVLAQWPAAQVWASLDAQVLDAKMPSAGPSPTNPWRRCQAGQSWEQDGVRFDILHPSADMDQAKASTNNRSCVLWVRGRSASALLTGDLDARHELALVREHPNLRADLLLAPHHGSRFSSAPEFLDAIHARTVIVQSGYRNRYGHPAEPVLDRYRARAMAWVASPECGAARWRSQAIGVVSCQRQYQARYWHWRPFSATAALAAAPTGAPLVDPLEPEPEASPGLAPEQRPVMPVRESPSAEGA